MKKQEKAPVVLTNSTSKYSFSNEKSNVHIVRKTVFVESDIASIQFQGSEKYSIPSVNMDLISNEPKQIINDVAIETSGYALNFKNIFC